MEENPNYFIEAPDVTLYTGFTWQPYLYIFFAHVTLHSIVIFIAKYKLSQVFRYGFKLLDKAIHSLENTNVPFNVREWDDGMGDAEEHRRRMRLNWREFYCKHFYFIVYKMQERHDILSRTIGYFDEEEEAFDRGYLLSGA